MELLTVATWLLYLLLAGLVGWGIVQMRSAIKRSVPPPASLTHMEREMFIPFDLDDIVREVAQKDRHNAKEVCRQLNAFFSVEAGSTAAELRHGFTLFDPNRTAPANYPPEKIAAKEERFLSLWRRILHKANFKPLSPEELDFALSEDYLSTLPIEINYDNLDGEILKRFNAKHPLPEGQRAHKEHDRIWIYRRGIGVDKTTSYFFLEKANLLIQLGVQWLVSKVMRKPAAAAEKEKAPPAMGSHRAIGRVTLADVVDFKKNGIKKSLLEQNTLQEPTFREIVLLYRRKPPPAPEGAAAPAAAGAQITVSPPAPSVPSTPDRSAPSTPRQDDKGTLTRTASLTPGTPGAAGTPPVRSPSTSSLAGSHRHREHREHKEKERKEHKEHREHKEKSVSRSPSTAELSASNSAPPAVSGSKTPRPQTTAAPVNPLAINIKTFINIPMADMEIIFPEKTVRMRPLDVVKFVATGAVAIITAVTNMQQDASAMLAGGLLVMLIGLASKVYIDYTTALREYDNLLTRSLYDKSLNNNTGAVIYLVDQVAQQEAKEAVLAYCILLNKGPATSRKLDQRAEKFLYKMSRRGDVKQDIDFDVHDALGKLAYLGVVKREADGTYRALAPTEALAVLKARWPEMLEREKDKERHGSHIHH